ncbi:MAG: deoxyribose-phosphate aldolase [Spartobacteria bacterium]|nr:deoxyribose-phosphate aldolase [Spartobacteria bacterium]
MSKALRIAIGSDHGGFDLKTGLIAYLKSTGYTVIDCGIRDKQPADYPRIALSVALRVSSGDCDYGIAIDGAGIGSAMAANKVKGVLAAACYNEALANNCREHNGANVLTLGAGQVSLREATSIVSVFLTTACSAPRHLRRVQLIKDIEQGHLKHGPETMSRTTINEEAAVELSPQDIDRIAMRVKELLAGGPGTQATASATPAMGPKELANMIDHTLLKPEASKGDIVRLCQEAIENSFFSVCVNPTYVSQARDLLKGSNVEIACVVGFPLGAAAPEIKALEARKAIREGATEIDMVINIGALKSGDDALVLRDIRGVVEACRERDALCKVILETSILTDDEKVRACELSMKARAHYVKTSTGFGSGGATEEDLRLMSRTVAPKKLGVKASGGVRTYEDAMRMIAAGATRIGASSSVKIIEAAKAQAATA